MTQTSLNLESTDVFKEHGEEEEKETPIRADLEDAGVEMGMLINNADDSKDGDEDEITFPESSHSFLFTHPVRSIPFFFSFTIAAISYACLIIALIDNITHNTIPVNVEISVRAAQYIAILIALLMEEEIPTALFLLKRISKPILHSKFPEISYWKFVASCVVRFGMGYLFLANVIVVLVQADNVLDIFYDVLALQFLQELDDIAFSVSQIEVLGRRMYLATRTPYFAIGFERQKDKLGVGRKIKVFLKTVYFVNLILFLSVMSLISIRQSRGYYHCPSYNVLIGNGNEVWDEAYVHHPADSVQYPGGKVLTTPLDFSNFNGLYRLDKTRTSEGRPIYVEQNKADSTPFDTTVPIFDTTVFPYIQFDPIKGAEFRYCGGRWLLIHDFIRTSRHESDDLSECGTWLLRSEPHDGFDLGSAVGWQVWEGEIVSTGVKLTCSNCEDNADCNLNGRCINERCECSKEEGVIYTGDHCEIVLKDECHTIISPKIAGVGDVVWSADSAATFLGVDGIFQEYNRPVYTYVEGLDPENAPAKDDDLLLIFSGSRYFLKNMPEAKNNSTSEFYKWISKNFHGFWGKAFEPGVSFLISEPTDSDTPVGVDFFYVGEQEDRYGPFGRLIPAFEYPGDGLFRCDVPVQRCQFCSNHTIVDPGVVVDDTSGANCSLLEEFAKNLTWTKEIDSNAGFCSYIKLGESLCCPEE